MRVLHWFRKGLRLHDNPALLAALNPPKRPVNEPVEIFFLYVYDSTGKEYGLRGYRQAQFLLESLIDLDQSLAKLDANFRLLVVKGDPIEEVPHLCKILGIAFVTFEAEIEPYSVSRDAIVTQELESQGVSVCCQSGHTMWDLEWLRSLYQSPSTENSSKSLVPLTYKGFCSLVRRVSPQGPPKSLPAFDEYIKSCIAPNLSNLELGSVNIGPPSSLDQLDIKIDPIPVLGSHVTDAESGKLEMYFPGGENAGLSRLQRMVAQRPDWVCAFAKPETAPTELPISTTGLSPYLRLGCLSSRRVWWTIAEAMRPASKASKTRPATQPPVSLHGQMLWREFFHIVASVTPNFDQIQGNPICRQIDWNYYRVYCPVGFGRKTDRDGKFIRHFLPVLRKMPSEYIYAPWTAPLAVQKKADCVIGVDYPEPIVDHHTARTENIERMKIAFAEQRPPSSQKRKVGRPAERAKGTTGSQIKSRKSPTQK
ncbi:hypothetical protein Aperf_G00000031642 [Anoplocephala perfoliata]